MNSETAPVGSVHPTECPQAEHQARAEPTPTAEANPVSDADTHPAPLTPIVVKLSGTDGNACAIIGRVSDALRQGGHRDLMEKFQEEATSGDYGHLLATCHRYVDCS